MVPPQASRAKRRRNAYAQSAVTLAERQEILARFRQATAQQKRLSVLDAQKAELFRLFVEHGSETRAGVGLDSIDRSELRFLMRRTAVLLNVRGIGSHLEHDLAPEYVLGDVVAYLLHVARDDPHFSLHKVDDSGRAVGIARRGSRDPPPPPLRSARVSAVVRDRQRGAARAHGGMACVNLRLDVTQGSPRALDGGRS